MNTPSLAKEILQKLSLPLVGLAALIPWLIAQMNISLNTNHAWLSIAAGRLLDGGHMSTDAYETNPPLSIMLYFPAALMTRHLGVPPEYAPYVFGLAGLALSSWAVWHLLKYFPDADYYRRAVFTLGYLIAGAMSPSNVYFGERDEFVLWGLFPFLLAQVLVTSGVKIPRGIALPMLFLASVCILIKPHYVIFPAICFSHRLIKRRSLMAVAGAVDFQALAAAMIAYAIIIAVFFMDYVTGIFPDFLKFYVGESNHEVFLYWLWNVKIAVFLFILAGVADIPKEEKKGVFALLAAGFLALFLFLAQGKGFQYHLIPFFIFSFCGGVLLFHAAARRYCGDRYAVHILTVIIMILSAYILVPLKTNFPTHEQYRQTKLTKLIAACEPHCPFFVFSENMEMIWQVSIYTGAEHASRFPGLWWLHYMMREGVDPVMKDKYAGFLGEDLARYKPKILAIATNLKQRDGRDFNFIAFFSSNEKFRREISHYKKTGVLHDNRRDYFKGSSLDYDAPIDYDIYERKK